MPSLFGHVITSGQLNHEVLFGKDEMTTRTLRECSKIILLYFRPSWTHTPSISYHSNILIDPLPFSHARICVVTKFASHFSLLCCIFNMINSYISARFFYHAHVWPLPPCLTPFSHPWLIPHNPSPPHLRVSDRIFEQAQIVLMLRKR